MFGRATITLGIGPHSSNSGLHCDVQAETIYKLEVRSLRSHVAEQEAALKCKEDIIDELRQTVDACGNENNSLRFLFY